MRDYAHPFISAIFRFFLFLQLHTAKTRSPIFKQNTPKDEVPRKDVPLGGHETSFNILAFLPPPQTAKFWADFRPKTA